MHASIEPPPTQGDLHFRLFGIPVRVHPFFWVVDRACWGSTAARHAAGRLAHLDRRRACLDPRARTGPRASCSGTLAGIRGSRCTASAAWPRATIATDGPRARFSSASLAPRRDSCSRRCRWSLHAPRGHVIGVGLVGREHSVGRVGSPRRAVSHAGRDRSTGSRFARRTRTRWSRDLLQVNIVWGLSTCCRFIRSTADACRASSARSAIRGGGIMLSLQHLDRRRGSHGRRAAARSGNRCIRR